MHHATSQLVTFVFRVFFFITSKCEFGSSFLIKEKIGAHYDVDFFLIILLPSPKLNFWSEWPNSRKAAKKRRRPTRILRKKNHFFGWSEYYQNEMSVHIYILLVGWLGFGRLTSQSVGQQQQNHWTPAADKDMLTDIFSYGFWHCNFLWVVYLWNCMHESRVDLGRTTLFNKPWLALGLTNQLDGRELKSVDTPPEKEEDATHPSRVPDEKTKPSPQEEVVYDGCVAKQILLAW